MKFGDYISYKTTLNEDVKLGLVTSVDPIKVSGDPRSYNADNFIRIKNYGKKRGDAYRNFYKDNPIVPNKPSKNRGWIALSGEYYRTRLSGHEELAQKLVCQYYGIWIDKFKARELLLRKGWCCFTIVGTGIWGAVGQDPAPIPTPEQKATIKIINYSNSRQTL